MSTLTPKIIKYNRTQQIQQNATNTTKQFMMQLCEMSYLNDIALKSGSMRGCVIFLNSWCLDSSLLVSFPHLLCWHVWWEGPRRRRRGTEAEDVRCGERRKGCSQPLSGLCEGQVRAKSKNLLHMKNRNQG